MKMVHDRTGRFPERPHYELAELDVECERLITDFMMDRRGRIDWPVTTDDITCLVERHTEDLDLYADLSGEGCDVEGLTEFQPSHRPRVRISATLATAEHRANRLRTTLTHELGHVYFHGFLFELRASHLDLFASGRLPGPPEPNSAAGAASQKCHRSGILNAAEVDWLEWQAGYACGAFLMPAGPLRATISDLTRQTKTPQDASAPAVAVESSLIARVADRFDVSQEAARIRLVKTKVLAQPPSSRSLFE